MWLLLLITGKQYHIFWLGSVAVLQLVWPVNIPKGNGNAQSKIISRWTNRPVFSVTCVTHAFDLGSYSSLSPRPIRERCQRDNEQVDSGEQAWPRNPQIVHTSITENCDHNRNTSQLVRGPHLRQITSRPNFSIVQSVILILHTPHALVCDEQGRPGNAFILPRSSCGLSHPQPADSVLTPPWIPPVCNQD